MLRAMGKRVHSRPTVGHTQRKCTSLRKFPVAAELVIECVETPRVYVYCYRPPTIIMTMRIVVMVDSLINSRIN